MCAFSGFNFEFDERFFDAVIARAGGTRLDAVHKPPPGLQNVDYLIGDHALELKNLETEPLEHPGRQKRFQEFLTKEARQGTSDITVDPKTGKSEVSGKTNDRLWESEFGNTIRKAMKKAAEQIADTRRFLNPNLRGAVLVVNQKATMIDGQSLVTLLGQYRPEFPELDVCFGYNTLLMSVDGQPSQLFGMTACFLPHRKDALLRETLSAAIGAELRHRGLKFVSGDATNKTVSPLVESIQLPVEPGKPPLRVRPQPGIIAEAPDFQKTVREMWQVAERVSAEGLKKEVKNCHYMPQFLMKRWADDGGLLHVVDISTNREETKTPQEIGAIADFYTTETPGTEPDRRLLESFLEQSESRTGTTLKALSQKGWHVSSDDKEVLSLFLAAMTIRLPVVLDGIANEYRSDWKPDWGLSEDGSPHRGNMVYRLLKNMEPFAPAGPILPNLAKCFFHRHAWALVTFDKSHRLQTGDIPIALNKGNESLPPEKWEIRLALDPFVLLTTNNRHDNQLYPEGTHSADPAVRLPDWNANGGKYRIL